MVAIIKVRLMLHLQSITCLEHFPKIEVIIFETDDIWMLETTYVIRFGM